MRRNQRLLSDGASSWLHLRLDRPLPSYLSLAATARLFCAAPAWLLVPIELHEGRVATFASRNVCRRRWRSIFNANHCVVASLGPVQLGPGWLAGGLTSLLVGGKRERDAGHDKCSCGAELAAIARACCIYPSLGHSCWAGSAARATGSGQLTDWLARRRSRLASQLVGLLEPLSQASQPKSESEPRAPCAAAGAKSAQFWPNGLDGRAGCASSRPKELS